MHVFRKLMSVSCLLVILAACQPGENPRQEDLSLPFARMAPDFDADSAYAFIETQVHFGPRIPSTEAHEACGAYLIQQFRRYGMKVRLQEAPIRTYDGKTHQLMNIIASFAPERTKRVLLSAHWDSRPFSDQDPDVNQRKHSFEAANDGASGVGVLLEIARQLQGKAPAIGIDFILWDLEDYGAPEGQDGGNTWCLGSHYWATHTPDLKPLYAINLDMVGGSYARFTMDEVSRKNAPAVVRKVWDIARQVGADTYFVNESSGPIMDDHVWINKAGIPAINVIDFNDHTGFYKYWHTQSDNLRQIDKNTLRAVGQVVLETIYRE